MAPTAGARSIALLVSALLTAMKIAGPDPSSTATINGASAVGAR